MSVAPRAPASRATSAATRFSLSMLATAPCSTSALAALLLAAVVITPVPRGFDTKSRSPRRRPPLMRMRSGWTRPVTQRPYLGSLSTTVWPPAMTPPASTTLSLPPRNTSAMIAFDISRGKPATASANSVWPPIAKTSDMAFAAEIAPQVQGSSPTGGKKSTVSTIATSGVIRQTAASSAAPRPTSRSGCARPMGLSASSTSWRSPGAILDAQPAQAAYEVSRTSVWVCLAIAVLRRVRRGLRFDELDEGLGERRAAPVTVGDQIERAPDAQILHPETEEEPRTALVLHRPLRDERDSDACAHALLDRLSRAHLADDTERRQLGVHLVERPLERFARARARLAHDEGLALDVGERHGAAVRPRVPRRDDDDELVGHQLARAEGLRTGRGADDADLGESFLDPRGDLAARADAQADRDVRILALESSDQRGQHVLARDRGAADDQLA